MIRVEVDRMMGLKTLTAFAMACALLTACSDTGTEADTEAGAESAAAHGEGEVLHWGYEEDDGPVRWGAMKPEWQLCGEGLEQSPIDLTNTTELRLPEVLIEVPSSEQVEVLNQAGVIAALDNGHTIQINSKTGEMMTVGDKTYELVQFHFHAPSEHTVDAVRFPMEMHFVYQADDGALAVSGVLIVEGEENPGIAPLWEQLAAAPGSETTVRIPREFGDQIFSDPASAIYHYRGSLTTPPCSEGVQWYISKTPTQFSEDQIAAFRTAYNHNNRSVQPLNERTLYLDPAPVIAIR